MKKIQKEKVKTENGVAIIYLFTYVNHDNDNYLKTFDLK